MKKIERKESDQRPKRLDSQPPFVIEKLGWRYHHLGIPTTRKMPGEKYIAHLKMYVSGFETSLYGIEWMRFEEGSPVAEIIQTTPHIAFEVTDLQQALEGKEIISPISRPSPGVKVAMIVENGAPIELIEFE
ncbi:hypothetical protein ACX8XP_05230 [Calditrichota bacterium LG25]